MIDQIKWQGHSSFIIGKSPRIQIAPWRVVQETQPPDVVLIGHNHYDHCSPADVEKVRGENTLVIGNGGVARSITDITILRDWQSIRVGKASVKAVPAYSVRDSRHPRHDHGLGFVISMNYFDIYYVGDSELVPELRLPQPDILLLPIDGFGRLSVDEALQLVASLKPRWTIPYNWGRPGEEATQLDARSFQARAARDTEVVLLPITP